MTNIYDQHRAAFANVSAFVILKDGERVATVAIKFPRDGAGRLYAYVHWLGTEMVRGFAGGYGYDKRTAAAQNAANKINFAEDENSNPRDWSNARQFCLALNADNGHSWDRNLELAGFTVLQAC